MSRDILLDQAIASAWKYLVQQADLGFPEARHDMRFPRAAGFTGPDAQSSDLFARAILGSLLDDTADLDRHDTRRAALGRLARREADYVASRKLTTRHGGWSYFPDLPELPPDVDSLSAVLSLFTRVAPDHIALCDEAVAAALEGAGADGSIETWIVSPRDTPADRARMEWGIASSWGTGTDPEVLASFAMALHRLNAVRYASWNHRFASRLAALQQHGTWNATWYPGPAYVTGLAVRLFDTLPDASQEMIQAARDARDHLVGLQRPDGGWGDPIPLPLETAVSLWALQVDAQTSASVDAGCESLLSNQNPDGSWFASPWIQMPIGRASGTVLRTATWESVTMTTAFCLRSLMAARAQLPA